MNGNGGPERAEFELEVHPPERRSTSVVLACGGCGCGCCCCCCCCAHTVGGLIGASVASAKTVYVPMAKVAVAPRQTKRLVRCRGCGHAAPAAEGISGEASCAQCGKSGPIVATAARAIPVNPEDLAKTKTSRKIGVFATWMATVAITLIALLASDLSVETLLVVGLVFPLFQVIAAIGAIIVVAIAPRTLVPTKSEAFRAIGAVLLGAVLGTIVGMGLMLPIGGLLLLR